VSVELGVEKYKKKNKVREFENMVMRKIIEPKRRRKETGKKCATRAFVICTFH
jgi:hypothetical protein